MDFLQTQTALNLARSFAGESQARNRYTIYAEQARREEQEYLARIFETTADNERAHAQEFLEKLKQHGGESIENIDLNAGYPFSYGNTAQNLHFAALGELDEHTNAYPAFSRIAAEEGYPDLAQLWKLIAVVEGLHHNVFTAAEQQLTGGTLYKKETPVVWRCMNCGSVREALEPWAVCPICGKPMGWVEGYVDERLIPRS
jgi:rubrerythrin